MAAASLKGLCEEALCSICLEYFEDPVTLECGHNFCRACLTQCWEELQEGLSCPQCRAKVRKHLFSNCQLANMVEIAKQLCLQEERWGVCRQHQEPLKLFCKEDDAPICVVCKESKAHRDHPVVPLEEEAQDYKDQISVLREPLEEERAKILAYKAETAKESQELLKQTRGEMEKIKEHFRELVSYLNQQEKLLLAQLEEVEKEITRERDEHLARLSEELSSLGGLIQEVEEKCQQPPGQLLKDVRNFLQRYEKKEPFHAPVPFPPELKWRFWDICDRNASLAATVKQFIGTLLPGSQLQKANVTLDPETTNPFLILSEDRKSVRNEGRCQDLPANPERFDTYLYVLGCDGFKTGRHYWEVTVENEESSAVGVARKSVQRKGGVELRTEEGIWAVGGCEGCYWTSNFADEYFLPLSKKLRRIRVSLNCEGDQVSFYDGDTASHLHTFSEASFSGETLLPFFYVDENASLTISP